MKYSTNKVNNCSVEVFGREVEQRHHSRDRMPTVERRKGPERVSISRPVTSTIGDLYTAAGWNYLKELVA